MTIQNLADILIGLIIVGVLAYRQLTWRVISPTRMWRMPLILGAVGVLMLAQSNGKHVISTVDIAVLAVELVISIGIGALMGRISTFRTRPVRSTDRLDDDKGRTRIDTHRGSDGALSVLEARTGGWGAALWIVLILARVAEGFGAAELGAVLATSTGSILLVLAANRAARTFVLLSQVSQKVSVAA
jgi:hypothetical protein